VLGTFTGEIVRPGTPVEVVLRKARMGMQASGLPLGLASEGSFGFHPLIPFIPSDTELLAFIDDEAEIELVEQAVSEKTNFSHCAARSLDDIRDFLTHAHFPSHAVIVRPHSGLEPNLLFKGIREPENLREAITRCAAASHDGLAHIETDMRAHMNPTRGSVIRRLAFQLGRRLARLCPACGTPGWGRVAVVRGLPCEWCGTETELAREEIYGCARCDYCQARARLDGLQLAPAGQCFVCNP
jgi:hypothetical protein